jgi:hypothetical protein
VQNTPTVTHIAPRRIIRIVRPLGALFK